MADKNIDYEDITGNQIDDILDEIDEKKSNEFDLINWPNVKKSIMDNNPSYIQGICLLQIATPIQSI